MIVREVMSVSLKFEPNIKCNCEYFWIGFLYWQLVYHFKDFGLRNLQYKIRNYQKSHNTVTISLCVDCGLNYNERDVIFEVESKKPKTPKQTHNRHFLSPQ